MTDTVTKARLESAVAMLNDALGMSREPWQADRDARGALVANGGTFGLDWAYGGVRLVRMVGPGGGQRDISSRGTKRECYDYIQAMLDGIRFAKESCNA